MRNLMKNAAVVLVSTVAACGGGGSTGTVQKACADHTNVPSEVCQCIGKKASALTKAQREFVTATIAGDQDAANKSQQDMDFSEIATAGTFFLSASADCSQELG